MSPLAGHKGYGLALCIAMLAGPLTGSAVGPELQGLLTGEKVAGMGHLFIAIDPLSFQSRDNFLRAVESYILSIKQSRRAAATQEIRVPGERAFSERAQHLRDGVPILTATWKIVGELAQELNIQMPEARQRTS
jgi:LDH2 family malate/lactate/ureidoglycolate dehydrogenase